MKTVMRSRTPRLTEIPMMVFLERLLEAVMLAVVAL